MSFFKQVGGVLGTLIGGAVSVPIMLVGGAIKAIETNGDWDQVQETVGDIATTCVEGGAKIGEDCEVLVEAAFKAGATVAGGHVVHKLLDDDKNKHKKQA